MRRILKWTIELGQFDINYKPRTAIKRQAFVDIVVEFTYIEITEEVGTTNDVEAMKVDETMKNEAPLETSKMGDHIGK